MFETYSIPSRYYISVIDHFIHFICTWYICEDNVLYDSYKTNCYSWFSTKVQLHISNNCRISQANNRYRTTTTTTLDCLPSVKSEASCGGLLQGKESIQNTSKIHEFSYLLLVSIPINLIDPIYE